MKVKDFSFTMCSCQANRSLLYTAPDLILDYLRGSLLFVVTVDSADNFYPGKSK